MRGRSRRTGCLYLARAATKALHDLRVDGAVLALRQSAERLMQRTRNPHPEIHFVFPHSPIVSMTYPGYNSYNTDTLRIRIPALLSTLRPAWRALAKGT